MFEGLQQLDDNWDNGIYVKYYLGGTPHVEEQHTDWIYTNRLSQTHLVSGSKDKSIRIWDLTTRRLEVNNAKKFNTLNTGSDLPGHSGTVLCVQFDPSPEEDVLISGSTDGHHLEIFHQRDHSYHTERTRLFSHQPQIQSEISGYSFKGQDNQSLEAPRNSSN